MKSAYVLIIGLDYRPQAHGRKKRLPFGVLELAAKPVQFPIAGLHHHYQPLATLGH